MNKLIEFITRKQELHGYTKIQNLINTGEVWKMECNISRTAMEHLKMGICYLPDKSFKDYWGNHIPSREQIVDGEMGTLEYCANYWESVVEFEEI